MWGLGAFEDVVEPLIGRSRESARGELTNPRRPAAARETWGRLVCGLPVQKDAKLTTLDDQLLAIWGTYHIRRIRAQPVYIQGEMPSQPPLSQIPLLLSL